MLGLIRNPKDFWTGLAYLGLGTAGLVFARDMSFGTGARMGPGYFPSVISGLLVLFGLLSVARSALTTGEPIGPVAWKAMALVVGATVAFGLLLGPAGLVPAIVILVGGSALASDAFRPGWRPALGLGALVGLCLIVFVVGLGLPMSPFGPSLQGLLPAGWR